jgi:hypothetical protein
LKSSIICNTWLVCELPITLLNIAKAIFFF